MKTVVFPYKMASAGSKLLAKALGAKRVKADGKFKPKMDMLIINWGNSVAPKWAVNGLQVLNHWNNIFVSHNKLSSLTQLKKDGVTTPDFTTDIEQAKKWIKEKHIVMCRTILCGHSGNGIVVAQKEEELVPAKLYTKYVKRKNEFRVVIFRGKIIDACEKRRKKEAPDKVNNFIRGTHNGYVFAYQNVVLPEIVKQEALRAMKSLQLDFGSVDVAYNEKQNKAYVFECNTAPGMSSENSPTLKTYSKVFQEYTKGC